MALRSSSIGLVLAAALLGGCHEVSGLTDFSVAGGDGGAGGGEGGQGGGGAGGAGAGGPVLVEEGLVARYFIDESYFGEPQTLLDAGPHGFELGVIAAGNLSYVEDLGHRGMRWTAVEAGGRASLAGVADGLDQATAATVEVVMELTGASNAPRILHVGGAQAEGQLAFAARSSGLELRLNGVPNTARWDHTSTTREVLHVRLDLGAATNADRATLFVNGSPLVAAGLNDLTDVAFQIPAGTQFVIGNRGNGDRSPLGAIYYLALYDRALGDEEIRANAEALEQQDDGSSAE